VELTETTRAGEHCRVCDPAWQDPLDTSFSRRRGGRWNPPGRYGALYLNDTVTSARKQVDHRFARHPLGVMMLRPERRPQLAVVMVARCRVQDCVTDRGLTRAGLPAGYPRHPDGTVVAHEQCWPLADAAHAAELDGVACRSAATAAAADEQELALFERAATAAVTLDDRLAFDAWYTRPPAM
jgi:RES domain